MSSKELFDIKQRVFYIDKHVNVFFNNEIMKLHLNMSKLNQRLVALEKRSHGGGSLPTDSEGSVNDIPVQTDESKPQKATKKKLGRTVTNIRTVNLG